MSQSTTRPTLILVDGHSLAYRSYYAFAKGRDGGLRTKTGIPTSICFGFLKCLLEVMRTQHPQAMAIAFDLSSPTFRHEVYPEYKADRKQKPEDFIPDEENLYQLIQGLNLPIFTVPRFEADDILGTIAQKAAAAGYRVKILSGDRDLFQLVNPHREITVLNFSPESLKRSQTGSITEFSSEQVKEKMGVYPEQIVDFKALCGDKSDNIPGVRGIGEKTAVQLLSTYNSLDDIYSALDKIKGAIGQKLVIGKEDAYKSRYLAEIVLDVPIEFDLETCILKGFEPASLTPLLEKLEFKQYLTKINELRRLFGGAIVTPEPSGEENGDVSLFTAKDTAAAQEQDLSPIQLTLLSPIHKIDVDAADQEQDLSPIQPQIINTETKLRELVNRLEKFTNPETPVAWDTETTSLEPRDAALVGIGCCWGTQPDAVAYIPLGHKVGENLNQDLVLEALRPILEGGDYPKTLQNAKYDRLVLRCQGISLAGVVFDTMLASYLLNPDTSHNLSALGERHLGLKTKSYLDLVPKGTTIADLDIPIVANYCGMDVYTTYALVPKLRHELEKTPKLWELFSQVEQPLEAVLADMEYTGVRINSTYLQELSQQLEIELAQLEEKATQIAGEKFNLGSPKQLSQILFTKLGLSTKHSRKIQTGHSTDAATLEKLQAEDKTGFVETIIEHRTQAKLKSTYVDALPALVRPDTQRVHTDFNQAVTSTGRLSSSNPNLQNIPIRTAFSRQIRKAFLPESGWLMVAADYSQIELRILAHLSEEPVLVQAFQQNEDIHTLTARLIYEKAEITDEERRLAKTINFGVIYGMGSLKFSRSTGIDKRIANEFIQRFNSRYPKVFAYLEGVKQQAITQRYVETILGRRRYFNFTGETLENLKGSNPKDIDLSKLKNLGADNAGLLRSAANAPIQGSSADIIKIAMVRIQEVLKEYQARLLLQVHDELVFEVPPQEWEELQPQIKSVMEEAIVLSVPLVVDVRAGENWMETK